MTDAIDSIINEIASATTAAPSLEETRSRRRQTKAVTTPVKRSSAAANYSPTKVRSSSIMGTSVKRGADGAALPRQAAPPAPIPETESAIAGAPSTDAPRSRRRRDHEIGETHCDRVAAAPIPDDHSAHDHHATSVVGGDRATHALRDTHRHVSRSVAQIPNGHEKPDTQTKRASGEGDGRAHAKGVLQSAASPTVAQIVSLWRMRQRWHRAEKGLILQGRALCRAYTNGDKTEANQLFDALFKAMQSGDWPPFGYDANLVKGLHPFFLAIEMFQPRREEIEKSLKKLAEKLPVWTAWAKNVSGLGALRLSGIVGEATTRHPETGEYLDIGTYRSPGCLWKRMGLAVIKGGRQRRVTDEALALEHGYSPPRRAVVYVLGTELIKAQLRNKDEDGNKLETSRAIGPYGQMYLDRKAIEEVKCAAIAADPEQRKRYAAPNKKYAPQAHAHNRAARNMTKQLLKHLWSEWRQAANTDIRNRQAKAVAIPMGLSPAVADRSQYESETHTVSAPVGTPSPDRQAKVAANAIT